MVGAQKAETQTLITGTCAIFDFIWTCRKHSKVMTKRILRWCANLAGAKFEVDGIFSADANPDAMLSGHYVWKSCAGFCTYRQGLGTWPWETFQITWNLNSDFLTSHFGYQGCRLLEEETHCLIFFNSNTELCGSSSGSGKTIAFLGPILASLGKPGKEFARALIVDPSRELATPSRISRVVMFFATITVVCWWYEWVCLYMWFICKSINPILHQWVDDVTNLIYVYCDTVMHLIRQRQVYWNAIISDHSHRVILFSTINMNDILDMMVDDMTCSFGCRLSLISSLCALRKQTLYEFAKLTASRCSCFCFSWTCSQWSQWSV